jgi:hypothetical protein
MPLCLLLERALAAFAAFRRAPPPFYLPRCRSSPKHYPKCWYREGPRPAAAVVIMAHNGKERQKERTQRATSARDEDIGGHVSRKSGI